MRPLPDDPNKWSAEDLIHVFGLTAAKMNCRECNAQPCTLLFVTLKKTTKAKIGIDIKPGYCAAHIPKPVRKKKRQ